MSSVKVLVVGSANGDLRNLCSKVGTMQAKHGPFDVLFCTGNFFAPETPIEVIDDLMENKLDFPITTYFMHGDNGVPGIIERTAKRKNGEICNNLFYLGKHGTMTTAESVKMASLSGTFDSAIFDANTEEEDFDMTLLRGRYTRQDVTALIQTTKPTSIMDTSKRGVDIFLSHEWPAGINKMVGPTSPPPTDLPVSTFSHPVANAASVLQPRYHFASSSGQFWERAPYKNVHGAEHATRFIALGDVGNKNKQRWFYAFNLVPLATVSDDILKASLTPTTTDSPLATASELKRRPEQNDDSAGFFWDPKRVRNEPPAGYVCRRCNQPGHYVKDCVNERAVPDGYICNKCRQPGHLLRDCPEGYVCAKCSVPGHLIKDCPLLKQENGARDLARGPPEGYVCAKCSVPGHYIKDCPLFKQENAARDLAHANVPSSERGSASFGRKRGGDERKAPKLEPCWFCLSNPTVDKNLIVSIGSEVYMAMSKGQLPETPSSLVPGGGHVLLISINHFSSFGMGDAAAMSDINSELRKYKEGLRKLYQSHGAGMVTLELSQGGVNQHAHIQIVPIPTAAIHEVERAFKERIGEFFLADYRNNFRQLEGASSSSSSTTDHINGISSSSSDSNGDARVEETSQARWLNGLPAGVKEGFLRIELPGDVVMVCPIPMGQRVNMQFGRIVLAEVLGMPDRAQWKRCAKVAELERQDSSTFKAAFKQYDFSL